MTVREMHMELRQSMNQVGANTNRKFQSEELDWILNKMQGRFIQSRLKPTRDGSGGFELDQINADQIRSLIKPSWNLVPYIDDTTRYKCYLPYDYAYLLSDWSYTTNLCGTVPVETPEALYITLIRQDYSTGASPSGFYLTMQLNFPTRSVTIPNDLAYGNTYSGYAKKEDINFLIPWIRRTAKVYWERFDDLYYPGYYIQVTTTPPPSPVVNTGLIVDGTTFSNIIQLTKSFTRHMGTGVYYDNRLTATNKISGLNSTAYYKTSFYSPISELGQGILYVYKDSSFTVNSVGISYVRKPLIISLSLNTSSELPEEFHQTICDMATQYIAGRLKDGDAYKLDQDDIDTRVVL